MSKGNHVPIVVGVISLCLVLLIAVWGGAVYLNMKNAEGSASAFGTKELKLSNPRASCTTQTSADGYISCTVSGDRLGLEKVFSVSCPSVWNFHFGCKLGTNVLQGN